MPIDGIGGGKPPGPGSVGPKGGVGAKERFSVETDPTRAGETQQADRASVSPLERFRRGEIDKQAYVELRIEEATRGLDGLDPQALESIRSMLRDQLEADPMLAQWVEAATGSAK